MAEETFGRERRGARFTKAVMAVLPLAIPRPSAATVYGLTIKELIMSVGGVAVIAGLLGLIWVWEASRQTVELQDVGRAIRLATVAELAALESSLEAEAGEPAGGRRMQLDIEAERPAGSIIGCLRPTLGSVGIEWSREYVEGLLGPAFTFSMTGDGGPLNHTDNYQWSYFLEMLRYLEFEHIDASLKRIQGGGGEPPPADPVAVEAHDRAKAEAWEKVRRAIDDGYPAIAWQPMRKADKDAGVRPLPFLWSLIVGYDEEAGTYDVHHSGGGRFTIGWDEFGHSDGVNWFSVMIFRPQTAPFGAPAANRRAIERAVESARGMYHGCKAPAHGLAAFDMWLAAFRDGTVDVHEAAHHAEFLIDARGAAAAFLREVAPTLPAPARTPVFTAAALYDEEVAAARELRQLCAGRSPDLAGGAEILSRIVARERAAVEKLQAALGQT